MSLSTRIQQLLNLTIPIVIGQLGQMLIVAGDVLIAGLYSTSAVAAIGVASGFINPIFYFGIGLTMGISPFVAYKTGAGNVLDKKLGDVVLFSLLAGLILCVVMLVLNNFVPYFGVKDELIKPMQAYIEIIAWSFPFGILFQGVREYLQGHEKVLFPNILSIASVLINLVVNYFLIFGFGRFQGLGEIGLAYGSLFIRVFMSLILILYATKLFDWGKFNLKWTLEVFHFSFPIAFMFFLEVLAFCTVSILSGRLDVVSAATNNIIMTMASISFMIPLSLSSAVAVKVGHALGEKDLLSVRQNVKASLYCVSVFIFCSSLTYFFLPKLLLSFFTQDNAVIILGVKLLFIVAIFQFSDGIQVLLSGILRGLKDTKVSFMMVLIGYWVIGIPVGSYLTFSLGVGVQGLWIGLAMALSIVAFTMSVYTLMKLKKVEV